MVNPCGIGGALYVHVHICEPPDVPLCASGARSLNPSPGYWHAFSLGSISILCVPELGAHACVPVWLEHQSSSSPRSSAWTLVASTDPSFFTSMRKVTGSVAYISVNSGANSFTTTPVPPVVVLVQPETKRTARKDSVSPREAILARIILLLLRSLKLFI